MDVIQVSRDELLRGLGVVESDKIVSIADEDVGSQALEQLACDKPKGDFMPWNKCNDTVAMDAGELHIWTGYDSAGKTAVLYNVITHLLGKGRKCYICSLEMPLGVTLATMGKQAAGCTPSVNYFNQWRNAHSENGFIYNHVGDVSPEIMLAIAVWCGRQGADHLVIDSLMFCGVGDEIATQTSFISDLARIAVQYEVCIHLVAHSKKPEKHNEDKLPSRFDVAGAKNITNAASKVWIVWRNLKREEEIKKLHDPLYDEEVEGAIDRELIDEPSALLSLQKNRQNGTNHTWGLWFEPKSKQFLAGPTVKPKPLWDDSKVLTGVLNG